uniref:UPF0538 protein C2orf76 homolog n=1 Tax=Hirondellea gigas TaxID=1518452 RepID=A0A2P2I2L2_9CRUS
MEATITIRCIRSFEHRNMRNLVLQKVDLSLTTDELKDLVISKLMSAPNFPPPFRKYPFDTFKIETQAFSFKTNDPIINREDDDTLILKPERSLLEGGVKSETEISFFKLVDYIQYKKDPVMAW